MDELKGIGDNAGRAAGTAAADAIIAFLRSIPVHIVATVGGVAIDATITFGQGSATTSQIPGATRSV